MEILSKKTLFLLIVLLFSLCFTEISSATIPDRTEIMSIAESYKTFEWMPIEGNHNCHKTVAINGCCAKYRNGKCTAWANCVIDTPDRNKYTWWSDAKGWKAEKDENGEWKSTTGIPYKWGGFSTLEEFGSGIRGDENGENKKCAGDIDCVGHGLSGAVGIDCSGFVSRCWNQNTKYGASGISEKFIKLKGYEYLDPGDALSLPGLHIMLFKEFTLEENKSEAEELPEKLWVYEASGVDYKVNNREYNIKDKLQGVGYHPVSPYKNIDVDLVIDRSGSMGGSYSGPAESKMADAKKAATMFVNLMKERDRIGVVSFANTASVNYQLTKIEKHDKDNPSVVKKAATDAIARIFASGGTSIGAGLQKGQSQLKTYGSKKGEPKVMILLSDGHEGISPWARDVLPGIINDKIKVCAIGLGAGADHELLNDIASQTDCVYKFAANSFDLYFIYRSLQLEVAGEDILMLSNKIRIVLDEILRRTVYVDSSVSSITPFIAWGGSDLDLTLIRPDRTIVDHNTNNPDIEFIEGDTYEFYRIDSPMHGEWEMVIKAIDVPSEGENFSLIVSGESAMIFEAELNKSKYSQDERIKITASAEDSTVDVPSAQYVHGMNISVEATNPNQGTSLFQLYDDGNHGDGEADDGIYANVFNDTQLSGNYSFIIKASGKTNRASDSFTREKSISTFVAENQSPIAEANGPYFGYVGMPIIFDASGSSDPKNQPLQYRWDFNNDGVFETEWLDNSIIEYTYNSLYIGKIALEVSNGVLTATDITEVNIKGAKGVKEKAVENLEGEKTGDKKIDKKINRVIKDITKSLQNNLWQDEIYLDSKKGRKVFEYEMAAIVKIKLYLHLSNHSNYHKLPENVVVFFEQTIENLVVADKILAENILEKAKSVPVKNPKYQNRFDKMIAKSEQNIEQAEQYSADNNPARAVFKYGFSWYYSEKAIRIANKN